MAKAKKKFPDLNKDGKITKADILKGRGVFKRGGKVKRVKSAMDGDRMNMPAFEAKSKSRSAADKMYANKASDSGLKSKLSQDSSGNYIRRSVDSSPAYKKGGKVKSRVNEAGNYTKPGMRKRLFESIKAGSKGGKPGQWSARKAQLLANRYKKAGGGYKN